jgi:hypothetical protein
MFSSEHHGSAPLHRDAFQEATDANERYRFRDRSFSVRIVVIVLQTARWASAEIPRVSLILILAPGEQ